MRILGFADFSVTHRNVRITARPGVRQSTVRHLLLDQVLPLALAAEGHLVLHASAVVHPQAGMIALAGRAGAGKSTLAAALHRERWRIASDDGVLVAEDGGRVMGIPAYPGLRLWPDAVEATQLGACAVSEVAEYSAKLRVAPAHHETGVSAPLRSVYIIEPGDRYRIEPLSVRDAAVELLRHAYRADLTDRPAIAAQLDACVRLAARTAVYRLVVPQDFAQLSMAAKSIGAHATVGNA